MGEHPNYSRRTRDQVIAAARAMDQARAAGLPDRALMVMLAARQAWWTDSAGGVGVWPPDDELVLVLAHPASKLVDEVVWAAMRRRVGT
jgi:hypothetical protein